MGEDDQEEEPCSAAGSIVQVQNQALIEAVPVTGTPFRVHYASHRVPGRIAAYSLDIPVSVQQFWRGTIGAWDARASGLGGWSLTEHHACDPVAGVIYLGDGATVRRGVIQDLDASFAFVPRLF